MRPLLVDDEAKAKVARVVEYAEAHHHIPGEFVPGDNPNFVTTLDTYRCVFTFTHNSGKVWRHLSISVPSEKYPNPAAAFMIATLFGFTGWDERTIDVAPKGWGIGIHKHEHCIVLAQEKV
jgi:hypothetical protein